MNTRYIWFALGIGAAFGSAVALLLAPQSGARTRRQLGDVLEDAAEQAGDYAENAGDYLKEQAGKLSAETQKALKVATDKAVDVASTAIDRSVDQARAVTSMF